MTMLEQIARAIYEKRNGVPPSYWGRLRMSHKAPYLDDARAALEAMLVPTEGMLEAVSKAEDEQGYCASAYESMCAKDSWPVMIKAAIEGK